MSEEPDVEPPEMDSYQITSTRMFEADFSQEQVQTMMQRTGAATPKEAIESVLLQREKDFIEPEQKLLGIDVQANETSNTNSD